MRRIVVILLFQAYAVTLALLQMLGGVRTDEAKYLLNIPYPHPPFVRSILSATEAFPYQELFWRFVFATLLVQSVWFIYDLGKNLARPQRIVACGMWVLSASVVLQAGTIMMAPLTAVQALFFLWLFLKQDSGYRFSSPQAGWTSLIWLASLFTAYQIVLYLPLIVVLFWKMRISLYQKLSGLFLPLVLLTLYTLSNPLIPASMLSAGTQNAGLGVLGALSETALHWILGGSLVLSTIGTLGMIRAKSLPLLGSLILVLLYITLSSRSYYPILFTPLFIGGVLVYPQILRKIDGLFACFLIATIYLILQNMPPLHPTDAERVMRVIDSDREGEYLLISGSFGHQWQYESAKPVRRFTTHLLNQASYVVCTTPCSDLAHFGWRQVENIAPEVWFNAHKESP